MRDREIFIRFISFQSSGFFIVSKGESGATPLQVGMYQSWDSRTCIESVVRPEVSTLPLNGEGQLGDWVPLL